MATFNTITRRGIEMQVIFTGEQYIFVSCYYGVLAVATRTSKTNDCRETTFEIAVENYHTVGGCLGGGVMETKAANYIRKAENEYTETKVNFTYVRTAGQTFSLEVKATARQ